MSWIWNIMLSFSNEEYWIEGKDEPLKSAQAVDKINEWLEADKVRNYGPLKNFTHCSHNPEMTANVFGGGFKHLDMDEFIEIVAGQEWQDINSVQLFIQGDDEGKFQIIKFSDEEEDQTNGTNN